jgi:hypothetical protein
VDPRVSSRPPYRPTEECPNAPVPTGADLLRDTSVTGIAPPVSGAIAFESRRAEWDGAAARGRTFGTNEMIDG